MPLERILRLLGYGTTSPSTDTESTLPPSQAPSGDNKRRRQQIHGTVRDLLTAGLLEAQAKIVSTRRAHPAEATVLPDGRIEYDGRLFHSPSGAADYVTKRSESGWTFWAVETDTGRMTLDSLRKRLDPPSTS
ncbi:hypothetical protein [Actinomadura sp. NPDC000929]|uniref:restriction system modified-DNA reader domain-containing protein n=1 Tax=Actinomadura sp. NPDC000929 TaxID=3154517 RepID=UPI003394DDAC